MSKLTDLLGPAGTVTSVAVSGTDGLEVDSGSPVTATGTIQLGVGAVNLATHLGLGTAAYTATTAYELAGAAGSAVSGHESAYDHTLIATALQSDDVGSAAFTEASAYDAAGAAAAAVSGHELAYDHTLIASALQPADVGSAAYEDTTAFDAAGAASGAVSGHTSTYDHTLIASALQPGAASVLKWTEAATAPASPNYGDRWFDTDTAIEYTYLANGGSPAWVEL
jgi:hypothetical protein